MATIDTIILDAMNAMQTRHATISGVTAPQVVQYPTVLDTAILPFAMTIMRSISAWQKGGGWCESVMTMAVLVYLDPVAQSDIPSHMVDGATLQQQFVNVYVKAANTALAGPPPPYQLTVQSGPSMAHISGGGPMPTLAFGGRAFFGFELSVPIRAEWTQ